MSGILNLPVSISIRSPLANDQRYIASTMWRSILGHNRAPSRRRRLNDQIDRILDDRSTRCLVACSARDEDKIVGWILYAAAPIARVMHYVYVREDERGKGIARALVAKAWPESSARFVVTMKGPSTSRCLETRAVSYVPLEEYLR